MNWGRARKLSFRYSPIAAVLVAVLVAVFVLPHGSGSPSKEGVLGESPSEGVPAPEGSASGVAAPRPSIAAGGTQASVPASGTGGVEPGSGGGSGRPRSSVATATVGPGARVKGGRCRSDGRMPIGTWAYSPPCMVPLPGGNGGATAKGVTKDEIRVVVYQWKRAGGAVTGQVQNDTDEDWDRTIAVYEKWFNARYETYGRRVKFIRFKTDADATDDQAVRADAVAVDEELHAFASINAPTSWAYCDELAARGVLCLAFSSPLRSMVKRLSPHLWSWLPVAEDLGDLQAEYVCKKLGGSRKAIYAGDAAYRGKIRKFGNVAVDLPNGEAKSAHAYITKKLAECGVDAELISYVYDAANMSTLATQAVNVIAKLKEDGVTTVICNCDPLFPVFLTNEADRSSYNPEWVVPGNGWLDQNAAARLFSQTQWAHAVGNRAYWAQTSQAASDPYKAYVRYDPNGVPAAMNGGFQLMTMFMTGAHLAGPNLNANTFREGMYRFPRSGGTPSHPLMYFAEPTRHGSVEDTTEIWYDPNAVDANGKTGSYHFVNKGRRYTYGRWTSTDTRYFDPKGTVVFFEHPPDEQEL